MQCKVIAGVYAKGVAFVLRYLTHMTEAARIGHGYLRDRVARLRDVVTTTVVVRATRLALVLAIAACSGTTSHSDTHARATDVQGACCENLEGGSRDQCLREIVRADDPAVAQTRTNQATYDCVAEHFSCNPATGRATPASAQAQHDCIEDLP